MDNQVELRATESDSSGQIDADGPKCDRNEGRTDSASSVARHNSKRLEMRMLAAEKVSARIVMFWLGLA